MQGGVKVQLGDVVQFNEKHKWCGALGIITEIKDCKQNGIRYMIGVPVPQQGTAYIFSMDNEQEIEYVGRAVLTPKGSDDDE